MSRTASTAAALAASRPPSGLRPLFRPLFRPLLRTYFFFWYFSGILHLLLLASGASGFSPLRHGLVAALIWLIPLLLWPAQSRRLAGGIGSVLWLLSLITLGYFFIYRQELSESALYVLFESNPAEAREFVGNYFSAWMVPAVFAYSAGAWLLWRGVKPLTLSPRQGTALALLIVAFIALPGMFRVYHKEGHLSVASFTAWLSEGLEPVVPWQFVVSQIKYREHLAHMRSLLERNRQLPQLGELRDSHAGAPSTLVLVIGESTSRMHMSLYGYPRPTNPRLESRGRELDIFQQAFSARPYTIETLEQALTFADQQHPDRYLDTPSIMNLMKQAGYRTWWISNQQGLTERNTLLTSFAEQTDEQIYLNLSRSQNSPNHDGIVLEPFRRVLASDAPRKFIVVHLLGTHMDYRYRYPVEFDRFSGRAGLPDWVSDAQSLWINRYDNAVLYNDFVISRLIDTLEQAGGRSLLLYFSDHGEDVFDWPPHDFRGRNEGRPTPPMYAIPFIIWRSPAWLQAWPRSLKADLKRRFQTSALIHTWADLVGLDFKEREPERSVINPRFREAPLWVGNPAQPHALVDLRTMRAVSPP